jgi:hypothetical protein
MLEHDDENEQQQETMAQFPSKSIADLVVYLTPPDYEGPGTSPSLSTVTTVSLATILIYQVWNLTFSPLGSLLEIPKVFVQSAAIDLFEQPAGGDKYLLYSFDIMLTRCALMGPRQTIFPVPAVRRIPVAPSRA